MVIEESIPLYTFTTMKVGGNARFFARVRTVVELHEALKYAKDNAVPVFIMGGGSNILVASGGFNGLVIKIELKGIDWVKSADGIYVDVNVASGELWDNFVGETTTRGLWGLENLSAIPGTVGASPVQNIDAYGVEAKDVILNVTAVHCQSGEERIFYHDECNFGYRDSFFKTAEGKYYIITKVSFRLQTKSLPKIDYKDVRLYFENNQVTGREVSSQDIRSAIIAIRRVKFPDLNTYGTAGSYFKNPIITIGAFETLCKKYPDMPSYVIDREHVKIPLAWVLDVACALKGFREGHVGLFEKQPLVLVNFGGAESAEILNFADIVSRKVFEATGILIEPEVEHIGF
jgi:UDP-N-acetylmuramate dehydrogenase